MNRTYTITGACPVKKATCDSFLATGPIDPWYLTTLRPCALSNPERLSEMLSTSRVVAQYTMVDESIGCVPARVDT